MNPTVLAGCLLTGALVLVCGGVAVGTFMATRAYYRQIAVPTIPPPLPQRIPAPVPPVVTHNYYGPVTWAYTEEFDENAEWEQHPSEDNMQQPSVNAHLGPWTEQEWNDTMHTLTHDAYGFQQEFAAVEQWVLNGGNEAGNTVQ